jgi:hypothetical protein
VNMNPRPESVMVLPHRDDTILAKSRYVLDTLLDKMPIPRDYRNALKGETRVASSRRRNMKDRLINCRKVQKGDIIEDPEPCSCESLKKALRLTDAQAKKHYVDGHLAIRGSDLPENTSYFLRGNLKNIPRTNVAAIRTELAEGVNKWIQRFTPICQDDKQRLSPFTFTEKYVAIRTFADAGDKTSTPMARVSLARFKRWHFEYTKTRSEDKELFDQCHGNNFTKDVIRMVSIHTAELDSNHWINHPSIYATLVKIFKTKTEYFASPLNFNLAMTNFFSEHTVDRLFGSKGNSWTAQWHQSGVANPIFELDDMRKTFAYAKSYALKSEVNQYIVTIPLWKHMGKEYMHFTRDPCVHPLLTYDTGHYSFHSPWAAKMQSYLREPPSHKAKWPVGIFLVRQSPLTDGEVVMIDALRDETQTWGFTPMDKDTMMEYINSFPNPNLEDPVIDLDVVPNRRLRNWPASLGHTKLAETTMVHLETTCDRYNLNVNDLLDEGVRRMKPPRAAKLEQKHQLTLTPDELIALEKQISEITAAGEVFEIDKNSSCPLYTCHTFTAKGIRKTFTDDDHYERVDIPRDAVIRRWEKTYHKHRWSRFSSFDRDNLPYGYFLPKNKDLAKTRPIVSYATHPMRPMLQRASRALCMLLKSPLIADKHLTLHRTDQFVESMMRAQEQCLNEGFNHTLLLAGDIKQMYTELSHSFIMEAFDWLVDTVTPQYRRKHISVPKRARKGAHMGCNYNSASFITFSLQEIRDIVKFDLDNAIFTVGETTMKQNIGIPMGSPISPVLAVLVCAYSEAKFKEAIAMDPTFDRNVYGARYVDDAIFVVGYNTDVPNDQQKAADTIDYVVKHGYPDKLTLECDPDQNYIKMLESVIDTTSIGDIRLRFWHKNAEAVADRDTQKFVKYQHFDSFSPYTAKRGVLISTLIRMRAASSTRDGLVSAIPGFVKELRNLNYPLGIIRSAVDTVTHRAENDPIWRGVVDLVYDA